MTIMSDIEIMFQLLLTERFPDFETAYFTGDELRRVRFGPPRDYGVCVRGTLDKFERIAKEINQRRAVRDSHPTENAEFKEGMRKFAQNVGCSTKRRIHDMRYLWDPSACRTVKTGITPGGRLYEVVDGQFGRRTVTYSANGWAHQTGPFVSSVVRRYLLNSPHGNHDNIRQLLGPRRHDKTPRRCTVGYHEKPWAAYSEWPMFPKPSSRLSSVVPKECRLLRTFVDSLRDISTRDYPQFEKPKQLIHLIALAKILNKFDSDLSGTYDPGKTWVRSRRLSKLISEVHVGESVPDPLEWTEPMRKKHKKAYEILTTGWGLMEYDNSWVLGNSLAFLTAALLNIEQFKTLQRKFESIY